MFGADFSRAQAEFRQASEAQPSLPTVLYSSPALRELLGSFKPHLHPYYFINRVLVDARRTETGLSFGLHLRLAGGFKLSYVASIKGSQPYWIPACNRCGLGNLWVQRDSAEESKTIVCSGCGTAIMTSMMKHPFVSIESGAAQGSAGRLRDSIIKIADTALLMDPLWAEVLASELVEISDSYETVLAAAIDWDAIDNSTAMV